jgi:hypothetical protein
LCHTSSRATLNSHRIASLASALCGDHCLTE